MELRKKLLAVVSLAFAAALSTGIAVSASAETEPTKLDGFKIDGVSVRVTDEVRTDADGNERNTSGIRFKTVTPEAKEAYEGARVVTTLTIDGIGSKDVAAQAWRTDSIAFYDRNRFRFVERNFRHYACYVFTYLRFGSFAKVECLRSCQGDTGRHCIRFIRRRFV